MNNKLLTKFTLWGIVLLLAGECGFLFTVNNRALSRVCESLNRFPSEDLKNALFLLGNKNG